MKKPTHSIRLTDPEIRLKIHGMLEDIPFARHHREQPVHTVYGGAHLFSNNTFHKLAEIAHRCFKLTTPAPADLPVVYTSCDLDESNLVLLHRLVSSKLTQNAIEDYRVDFEDGYGVHSEREEDMHAASAAAAAATSLMEKKLPDYFGIRIKAMTRPHLERNLKTLDIFLNTYLKSADTPRQLIITLPKVSGEREAAAFREMLAAAESSFGLPMDTLRSELMIETPAALFAPDGTFNLPRLIRESGSRLFALHAGLYDFTAALGVLGNDQRYSHSACDSLRFYLRIASTEFGVNISDGATVNIPSLPRSAGEKNADMERLKAACVEHYNNVRHSMRFGILQGWDLHPAQIPPRLISVFKFFLKKKKHSLRRLSSFLASARAVSTSGDFDDAATAQGLINFVRHGHAYGLISREELGETALDEALIQLPFQDIISKIKSRTISHE